MIESSIKALKIAAGHSHSGCINTKGDIYTWGCNIDHRLMKDNTEIDNNSLNEDDEENLKNSLPQLTLLFNHKLN